MPTGDPFSSAIVVNYMGADDAITRLRSRADPINLPRAHRRQARMVRGGNRG